MVAAENVVLGPQIDDGYQQERDAEPPQPWLSRYGLRREFGRRHGRQLSEVQKNDSVTLQQVVRTRQAPIYC